MLKERKLILYPYIMMYGWTGGEVLFYSEYGSLFFLHSVKQGRNWPILRVWGGCKIESLGFLRGFRDS